MLPDPAAPHFLLPLCFWGCLPWRDEAAAALRSLAQHCDTIVKARLIHVCVWSWLDLSPASPVD